jgi:hypothetical protein
MNKQKTTISVVSNQGPTLGQAPQCGGGKSANRNRAHPLWYLDIKQQFRAHVFIPGF